MNFKKYVVKSSLAVAVVATATFSAGAAIAECASDALPGEMAKPDGYPARALTMVVPYGPAGGSGQVAQAMAKAVTDLTGVSINRRFWSTSTMQQVHTLWTQHDPIRQKRLSRW